VAPRNDIAIYAPFAHIFYESVEDSADEDGGAGGAELQTALLAREMAVRGFRVAHIVYPLERNPTTVHDSLEVVERGAGVARRRRSRLGRALGKLVDAVHIWRALAAADARAYLFRTGLSGGSVGFVTGALFTLLHRRRLVFAASSDLDFVFGRDDRPWWTEAVYKLALKRASPMVVQSRRQGELAAQVVDSSKIDVIPSFAEPGNERRNVKADVGFVWAGRLVEYKLPLRYLQLAESVPEARFRMFAIRTGETPQALRKQLAEEAAQVPNLALGPGQSRERLLEFVAKSTAVVVTSRHEGMPNLFLEAWARGTPVLSLHFDPDGVIAAEALGICAGGSWSLFVAGARRLWGDERLRRELGERGRAYVRRVHSVEAVAGRWAEVLRATLD